MSEKKVTFNCPRCFGRLRMFEHTMSLDLRGECEECKYVFDLFELKIPEGLLFVSEGEKMWIDIDNGCGECCGDLWGFECSGTSWKVARWKCEECLTEEGPGEPLGPPIRPSGTLLVSRGMV